MTSETKPSSAVTLGRHSVVALAVFWCVWVLGSGKGTVAWRALATLHSAIAFL